MSEIHDHAVSRVLTPAIGNGLLVMLLAALLAALPVAAQQASATPLQQFDAFSSGLESFSARFAQTMFDANGRQEEFSEGVFYLRQPDLMHWKYEHPYPQLIVADGDTLWSWDIELEQITRREQSAAEQQSPLTLITDPERLRERFTLQSLGVDDDGLAWLELQPIASVDDTAQDDDRVAAMAEFSRILVAFEDSLLAMMVLEDSLGQRTEVRFSKASRNVELDPDLFQFVPPEGVDVLQG